MFPGNFNHASEVKMHSSLCHFCTIICGAEEGETEEDSHLLARERTCVSISSKNITPHLKGLKDYGL